jgi:hypothetical protein
MRKGNFGLNCPESSTDANASVYKAFWRVAFYLMHS